MCWLNPAEKRLETRSKAAFIFNPDRPNLEHINIFRTSTARYFQNPYCVGVRLAFRVCLLPEFGFHLQRIWFSQLGYGRNWGEDSIVRLLTRIGLAYGDYIQAYDVAPIYIDQGVMRLVDPRIVG